MSGKKKRRLAPSATPWDGLEEDDLTPAQVLVAASHKSMYGFKHESFGGDAAFFNAFERDSCPRCGNSCVSRRGLDARGMQRYRCHGCGRSFTPATGTIFEDRKLPLPAWVDFMLQAFSFESLASMTRENRRSDTTPPYWMAKLFAVLEGIQDATVLSATVQIDETYYPIPNAEALRVNGKLLRGLSRNKICIGIGCDESGRSIFFREGFGKTSSAETIGAFAAHIQPGSLLVHDMEKAHRALVEELKLRDEKYNSRLISKLPDKDNPMHQVNRLCFLLKLFLDSHSGFDRDDLDGYLDLFSVVMNPPAEKMEKVALVLERAMGNPNTLRFRDFYSVKAR